MQARRNKKKYLPVIKTSVALENFSDGWINRLRKICAYLVSCVVEDLANMWIFEECGLTD